MEIVSSQPEQYNHPSASNFEVKPGRVEVRPAGFVRRAIAYTIDLCIIFVLFFIFISWGAMGMESSGNLDLALFSSGTERLVVLSFVFLYIGYFTFFHATCGQTPAKMILRIIVLNKKGVPPSYFRALMRSLGLFPSHLFFGFGFLLAMIGQKKRALHDFLSGTQVMLAP